MTILKSAGVGACTIALALFACSRDAPQTRPSAEPLAPASGPPAPRPMMSPRCADHFAAFDQNGDGRVTREEFLAKPHAHHDAAAVFGQRDQDGDGSLTQAEFCVGWRGSPGAGRGMRPAPKGRMGHGKSRGMMGPGCEQHFEAFDENQDGKLTKEEFAAWPHAHGDAETLFRKRDRDGDGTITTSEFCEPWE